MQETSAVNASEPDVGEHTESDEDVTVHPNVTVEIGDLMSS